MAQQTGSISFEATNAFSSYAGGEYATKETATRLQTAIEQNAENITLRATKAEFDALSIGGRNYILDSASISASGIGSASGSRKEYQLINVGKSYMGVPSGTQVTISFDLYMTVNTANPSLMVYNTNSKGPKQFHGVTLWFTAAAGTTISKRVSVTEYISDRDNPTLSDNYLEFYSGYGTSNWFSIKNLKLELGNRATDWTPAPEDMATAAELKVANDQINLRVEKSGVISSINQSAETIKISADKVQIDGTAVFSAIKGQADAAYDAKGAAATVQENLDNLQVGGRNLVWDTEWNDIPNRWQVWGSPTTREIVTINNKRWLHLVTTTSPFQGYQQGPTYRRNDISKIAPGDTLIASCMAYAASDAQFSILGFHLNDASGIIRQEWCTFNVTTTPQRFWARFTIPDNTDIDRFNVMIGDGTNKAHEVWISEVKLEKGNKATDWSPAPEDIDASIATVEQGLGGFDILWNRSEFAADTNAGGECYLCAYDPTTATRSDANGWAMWNGTKRTITKGMFNPNKVLPYNIPIYIVYRLSSATATTGTHYMVWYDTTNSKWRSGPMSPSTSTLADWTWAETTDMILGKFVEPGSEVAFTECETYRQPIKWGSITTDTVTARSANAIASSAQTTANNAAPKATAIARSQRIYYRATSASEKPAANTTWLAASGTGYKNWSLSIPPLKNGDTKYPFLYTTVQTQTVAQQAAGNTCSCTPVLIDETTTVIDGATIITGSVHANSLDAESVKTNIVQTTNLDASKITSGSIGSDRIKANVINAVNNGTGTINADKINVSAIKIGDLSGNIGGRNLLLQTGTIFPISGTSSGYFIEFTVNNGLLKNAYELEDGVEYTFSVDVTSSRDDFMLSVGCGSGGFSKDIVTNYGNSSGRVSITFVPTAAQLASGKVFAFRAPRYSSQGTSFTYSVDNVKLEKGSKPTDWSPAPEDQTAYVDDSIDSISVGSRNFLLHSNDRTKWPINNPTSYFLARVALSENLVMGDTYTLQVWGTVGRSDKSGTAVFSVYWGGGSVPLGKLTPNSARDYWTLTFTAPSGAHNDKSNAFIHIYNTPPIGASGTTYSSNIIKAKLERGNKPTDWTPAPEDISQMVKINAAALNLSTAQWKSFGAVGHVENWTTGPSYNNSHIHVGDTAYITGTVTDGVKGTATIIGTVTGINGTSTVTMSSTQLIFGGDSVDAASKTATTYLTEGTSNGLMVHRSNDTTTGVKITDDVDILREGASVCFFGTDEDDNAFARIGYEDSSHLEETPDGVDVYVEEQTLGAPVKKISLSGNPKRGTTAASIQMFPAVGAFAIDVYGGETFSYQTRGPMVSMVSDTPDKSYYNQFGIGIRYVSEDESEYYFTGLTMTFQDTGTLNFSADAINFNNDNVISGSAIASLPASKLTGTIADSNLPTKDSAGTAGTLNDTSGATLAVPYVTTDAYGRVTAKGTHTHTIGSLAASAVSSGTFDAARIPNLNASKINAGTLNSARLPTVPVDKGGTGQTGVTTVTTVASFIAAASGVTISSVRVTVWGKLVHAYVVAKPSAAQSAAWVVGTVVDAYKPNAVVTGKPYYTGVDSARIQTNGQMQITACGAHEVGVSFTYLLA